MPKKVEKDITLGQYQHDKPKRANNPQVGLVSSELDSKPKKKKYEHDPYVNPFLSWAGKKEGNSFEIDTVSLHIHERIDPKRIIKQVLTKDARMPVQPSLFETYDEQLTLEKEFDFYGHTKNWSNRLIAGDSLLVMNSLLEKENMAGKVQMVYIDPPYGIKYNSNFQPFTNKREVKDNNDDDIPAEPEMIKAFRDTWELGINSYLTYLRDRLLLTKELLNETGSVFVQISDENVHLARNILDEIFGKDNFVVTIVFTKTGSKESGTIDPINDYLLWYSKDKNSMKIRKLFDVRDLSDLKKDNFKYLKDGTISEIPENFDAKFVVRYDPITSDGYRPTTTTEIEFDGKKYFPGAKNHWKTSIDGLNKLNELGRLVKGKSLQYLRKFQDFPVKNRSNLWSDLGGASGMIYVVQTNPEVIKRVLLMTSDPGDLALDITCGGGTTAYVAEQWGRRWITCDTSRVAIQLAKQRLMTAKFDYYEMQQSDEGVSSGFRYKTVPHITLGSIANNETAKEETLYDQPLIVKNKVRVSGPFTVEAVPGVRAKPIESELPDVSDKTNPTNFISEKLNDYMDSIRVSGIRSYNNEGITFNSVEIAEGFQEIHAFGSIDSNGAYKKCAIVFGPDYAPMEQTQIERTMDEIRTMSDKPAVVVFCSYAFDPEASKDIDNIKIKDLQILKAQMNTDLLTKDLRKKANTNRPFWLIGEPDIEVIKNKDGKYLVEVKGFDYYDPRTQELKGGSTDKISMWMLDTDYDNRSLFPTQIFFPMHDEKKDWTKLAKALNGNVDQELLEQYTGTVSIPFTPGDTNTIAVKIVDDRGVEMLIVKKL